jgi:predicted anti-sigma-YlaC factor YlaD
MTTLNSILFLAIPLGIFAAVFSGIARWRGIGLSAFWATPLGAVTPWLIATAVALVASFFVRGERSQAAGMSVLMPMLATMAVFIVACVVSLFLSPAWLNVPRFKWAFIVSAIPAFVCVAYLVYVMFFD